MFVLGTLFGFGISIVIVGIARQKGIIVLSDEVPEAQVSSD